jgi:PAS domain S-box-containing protein
MTKTDLPGAKAPVKRHKPEQRSNLPGEHITEHPEDRVLRELVDEERYKAVFESANDLMLLLDKKGRIIDINGRSAEISGYSKEEVIGKHVKVLSRILTKKSLGIVVANLLKRMAGFDVAPYEIELIRKDGELLTFEISGQPLKKDGKIIGDLGILRDVTERKRVEDEIRQKSADLRLINIINDAANQGLPFEEIFQLVSREMQKLFGSNVEIVYMLSKDKQFLVMQNLTLPPKMTHGIERMIGDKISDVRIKLKPGGNYTRILEKGKPFLTNDPRVMLNMASECTDKTTVLKLLSPIIKAVGVNSVISVPLKSDHDPIGLLDIARHDPFDESDMQRVEAIAGQLTTIIRRRMIDDTLRQNEELLRNMIEASSEGFALCDGIIITDINKNGARILGYEPAEMIDKNFTEFIDNESVPLVMKNMLAREDRPYEASFKKKDGTVCPVEIRTSNIIYKGKDIRLASFRDLTEQKQYNSMLEEISLHAPIGMYVVLNGRFIMVNKHFCQDTGYSEQELLSMNVLQGVYPGDLALLRKYTIQMLKGQRTEPYEFRVFDRHGEIRYVLQSVAPIDFLNQRAYLATYLDITEKRKTEMALMKSEQNLKQAQALGKFGNWQYDIATQKLEWSDEAYKLYERNKALGPLTPEEEAKYYTPEEYEKLRKNILNSVETGSDNKYDLTATLPAGKTISLSAFVHPVKDDTGRVIKLFGTVQDISDRKLTEQALQASEQNFRNSMNGSSIGIRISDIDDHTLYVNQALLDIFGYANIAELRASPPQKHYTPESQVDFLQRRNQLLSGEPVPDRVEINIIRRDGTLRYLQALRKEVLWDGKNQYQTLYNDITELKWAEKALKESEEKYSALIEQSTDGIVLLDGHKIQFTNQRICEMSGYSQEELLGKQFVELIAPEHKTLLEESHKHELTEGEVSNNLEMDILAKDGRKIAVETKAHLFEYKNKTATMVIISDVTKRKQAEKQLKESEENLKTYLENAPDGIFLTDLHGVFLYGNKKAENLLGYKKEELIGKSFFTLNILPMNYYEKAAILLEQNATGRNTGPDEFELTRKDSSTTWVEINTAPITQKDNKVVIGFVRDVTERKLAEEALKASEEKYSTLIEQSADGIIILNDRTIEFANRRICQMSGYSQEEIVGKKFPDLFAPEYRKFLDEGYRQRKEGEVISGNYELAILASDGRKIAVETEVQRIVYKDRPSSMIIIRDVTERKQAQLLYQTLVDSAPVGVYIAQENKFIFTNHTFQDKSGYGEKELRELSPTTLMHPEDKESASENRAQMLDGRRIEPYEYRIFNKNGDTRWALEKVAFITYQGKEAVMGITIDTTESKQAREMYQTIADSSPVGVYIIQGREFVYTNPAFQKIAGYTGEELKKMQPVLLVHPEDRMTVRLSAIQMLKGQRAQPYEFRLMTKSGEVRWGLERMTSIIYEGKPAAVGNFMDITERKQVEEKLGFAAQEWRTTFDSITDMISIHDKENRILRVNKAVADMLKTTPKELIGKSCHVLMHGTKEPPANCPHLLTLKTGKPASIEIYNPFLEATFHESTSPIFNEKGEVTGTVIVTRDVTNQKRIEEQLMLTDRLASIGELSSGIAHELNNPLTSVIGFSQLLMEGDIPANIREDLGTVYSEAQRAASIVKNLLTFARKHAPVKQLCQINSIIEDVLRLRAYEQRVNNIEIINHMATGLPGIMIDHFQMQQVFLNIIVNAEFAMLEAHRKGKMTITTEKIDDIVRISFADDGPGISEENMKRIFDPFFTTKEVGKGTGLGLSICHGIVTEHGGKIYVKSEKGLGADFIVELPLNR